MVSLTFNAIVVLDVLSVSIRCNHFLVFSCGSVQSLPKPLHNHLHVPQVMVICWNPVYLQPKYDSFKKKVLLLSYLYIIYIFQQASKSPVLHVVFIKQNCPGTLLLFNIVLMDESRRLDVFSLRDAPPTFGLKHLSNLTGDKHTFIGV